MPYKDPQKMKEYMRKYRKDKVYVNPDKLSNTAIVEGLRKPENIGATLQEMYNFSEFNQEHFDSFMKRPYTVMPKSEGEWYLIVPKFSGLEYGWLFHSDEIYNIFIINRYVSWLTPLPEDIKDEIDIKEPELDVKIHGNIAEYDPEKQDLFKKKFRESIYRKIGPGKSQIIQDQVFKLTAQLIREGVKPYTENPVDRKYFSDSEPIVELRDYQEFAWQKFLEYGSVGIFWPPGGGKMFISLYALARLQGPKLIIVPSLTLREQWEEQINIWVPPERRHEIEITSYISAKKYQGKTNPYTLTIFDEAHYLPANTYGPLSNINTLYRMGLSATPFREDGRTDLIFALTGFPVGMDWKEYIDSGLIHRPKATCYITKNMTAKKDLALELSGKTRGKSLVFVDKLEIGKELASKMNIPFVYGNSKNRLQTIRNNRRTVVSRVGDEGLDITDLESVIEVDFLFGSRRQEMQRFGRLLHSRYKGKYVIIMTKNEYNSYKKRLLALFEKGFEVDIRRLDQ